MMKRLIGICAVLIAIVTAASAADIRVAWDANDPAPEGYRVYLRYDGNPYDYAAPVWQGPAVTSDPITVDSNRVFHLVVRAYLGTLESADSEEISHAIVSTPTGVTVTVLR